MTVAARLCLAAVVLVCAALCPAAWAQCAAAPYNASACSTLPPVTDPVCLPASDSAVQGLLVAYPNCLPLFELATARGDGIWLTTDPHASNNSDWVITNLVFSQIISGSAKFARTLGTLRAVPGSSLDCLHAYIRYTCARLFRTCDLSDPRTLRRAPCQDTCALLDSVTQTADGSLTCRQLVYDFLTSPTGGNQPPENANFFLPPCDTCESGCTIDLSTPAVYGQPSYPNASQTWDLGGGLSADVACADFPIENFIQNDDTRTLFPCHDPWVPAPASRNAYCGIGCPIQLVDLSVYDGVATLCAVFSWISYILTALVIFTMCFIPRYRRFPSCMILTAAVGAHILSFGFLFVTTRGFKKVTCQDSVTYRYGLGASACVFQTLVFEVGISLVCWSWACIGINSAISIGLRKDKWLRSKWCYVPQFFVTFVWPVAACIASLGIGQFTASGINIVCFTIPKQEDQRTRSWTYDWLFVYVPLAASLLVVLPTVSVSIYGMRHFRDESSARIQRHVRVILFLLVLIPILAFAFVYRVYTYQRGAKWGETFQVWAAAALLAPAERPAGEKPSSGLFYGSFFVFTVEGTLIALLFGTNKDIVGFWLNGFRHLREGRSFFASGSASTDEGSVETSVRSTHTAATYNSSHY